MAAVDDVSTAEIEPVIRNVTVAGITGAIGVPVITALHDAGFSVRALTRSPLTAATLLPPAVDVLEVDYTSPAHLRAALRGQDAVISALGDTAPAVAAQEALIHAAAAVGVKRFFPSEFGSDTLHPRVRAFPFFAHKLRHQDLLAAAAQADPQFSYTIVITGPFLDWGLSVVPFIINVGAATADVFDGGAVPFSTTRIPTLAAALVSTLQPHHLPATANRTLYIHDGITTQNALIALASSGHPGRAFVRTDLSTAALEAAAWTAHADSTADPLTWILGFVNLSIWSGEELCAFRRTDNAMLGLPEMGEGEVEGVLREEVERARAAFGGSAEEVTSAEEAFEEGKRRLEGFVDGGRARSGSQVERVVG